MMELFSPSKVHLPILVGDATYTIFVINFILDRPKETKYYCLSYIVAADHHANVVEWPLHYSFSLKMESVLHFES
jgi:hypothetical protein